MEKNITELLGIALFESDEYVDVLEDCTQYTNVEWYLDDMKKFDGMVVALFFDGRLQIYNSENEIVLDGSLMDSSDFKKRMYDLVR